MRVVFSERSFTAVLAETTEKIKTETGGLFLGVVQDDTWYIIEAIDPGPKSIFEVAYFEYDQQYTQHLINKVANLYAHKLDLIGLWHRHPGSFDQFSSTDDGTNSKYASMRKEGAISALVNIDPDFRITFYHVAQPCKYKKIEYDVGDNLIPDELLCYKTKDQLYDLMQKRLQHTNKQNMASEYRTSISLDSFMNFILPQLSESECENIKASNSIINDESIQDMLTETIIDDLAFMVDNIGIHATAILENQYLTISQEAINKTTKIYFMYVATDQKVYFSYAGKCYLYHSGMFEESCKKAKEERDRQATVKAKDHKPPRVLGSVIRIINFNRNEE